MPANPTTAILEDLRLVLDVLSDEASGCALEPLPCRVSLYPGGEVPWDSCEISPAGEDGQLWAAVQSVIKTVPSEAGSCNGRFQVTAEIGVVRCAAKPQDDGTMPSVAEVEADARQQAADSDKIREAVECCITAVEGLELASWTPALGGGCVGGFWTLTGVWDGCC